MEFMDKMANVTKYLNCRCSFQQNDTDKISPLDN